ncbi:hypothetical protein KKA01_04635 [Patescibacteria group bacterium]|nr:hypothetical protein [Patescibacteria group bacterium]
MKRRLVPLLIAAFLIMTAMTATAMGYENAPAVQNDGTVVLLATTASNVENVDYAYFVNGVPAETEIIEKANLAQVEVSTDLSNEMAFLMGSNCATSTSVNTSAIAINTRATTAGELNATTTAESVWCQFTSTACTSALERNTRDATGIHFAAVVQNDSQTSEKAAKKQVTNKKRTDVLVDTNGVIRG